MPTKFHLQTLKKGYNLEDPNIDGRTILIRILNKHDLSMWDGFNQLSDNEFQFSTEGIIKQCYFQLGLLE
jgi:hypothetical protein